MAKPKSTEAQPETTVVVPMTGRAIGIVQDPETQGWSAVVLEFSSESGLGRVVKSVPTGTSRMEAGERFKLLAVEEGLVV